MNSKILLIDDVKFFLELEKNYLSNIDCEIFTAFNGKEGLEIVNVIRPDLIFVDYEMPVMNGLEFIKQVKGDQSFKDIPVVLVSAFIDDELKKIVQGLEVNRILKKPFTREDFIAIVNEFLRLDKRKKERVKINMPAFYGFEDKMEKGAILDISEGGAFLAGDVQLKEGALLEMKFLIPNTGNLIKTWAKIVWINDEKNKKKSKYPAGMGVEFISMSKDAVSAIRKFIEEAQNESKNL
ncbi:MAG: response regulator [Proteobacteria bacterium]|nr:response regulator [Pseudomonadota bacterium]